VTRCAWPVLAIIAGCGRGGDPAPASAPPAPGAGSGSVAAREAPGPGCEPLAFAGSTPVPEASGAAWLTIDGKVQLVVVGDSGNHGAYGIVDPDTGATGETGVLPLAEGASDDVEGVAARGDRLYGITSSGWIREWRRKGQGFELVAGPYPLGPVDLPDTKNNDRAPRGDGMVCKGPVVNCGRNYEGLCLMPGAAPAATAAIAAPGVAGACVGFAASKADGHLYCLTEDAGKLVVHHDRAIEVTRPGALADCAFGDDGRLWAGSNLFDLGRVVRVTHWDDPAAAKLEPVGALAIGFPETLAVRGDVVYRMSDMGGAPSLMARWRCR
jgi:hypothetical protein